ncbi:MAG: hypothetical protein H6719_36440 [Sandaracinaceae bacterium]|nr:hypothetical protein [Sandaracinaceae bacterium]
MQLYDVVNVGTDPHLKEPALSGALHRFESGEALAIAFVYHDPGARKLALVVPTALRHEEIALRAKLLTALAEDRESPIPGYVAEGTTVVGVAALKTYLEAKDTRVALGELELEKDSVAKREHALLQRETILTQREAELANAQKDHAIRGEALSQREERLHSRAETVTRREDELRTLSEEIEAARADLRMQEQELESRFEMLHEREEGLIKRAESGATPLAQLADVSEVAPVAPEPRSEVVELPAPVAEPVREVGDDDVVQLVDDEVEDMSEVIEDVEELEELEDLEPLETSPAVVASPAATPASSDLSSAIEMAAQSMRAPDVQLIGEDDVVELEEVEAIEDVTGVHANLIPEDLPASKTVIALPADPEEAPLEASPQPSVPPPAAFAERLYGADAVPVLAPDGVRIFATLPVGKDEAFAEGSAAELLVQLVVVEECPVVLLTVVEDVESRPVTLRAPLDPRTDDGREILERLRRDCAARVSLHASSGRYLRAIDARGPRELNVLRVLDRVAKMRTAAAVDITTAVDRVLGTPPPVRTKDHPFVPSEERVSAKDAAAAKAALEELATWATHDRMDRALLGLSVPADHVDGTLRHHLEEAVSYGLPLTPVLRDHAIALDVALDAAELVAAQIRAFVETTKLPDRGGLSTEDAAAAFEALLGAAADAEVAIDSDTHEHAWGVIRRIRGGDVANVDPKNFPNLSADELLLLLEHPKYRQEAALELASRKEPQLVERLCKVVRKMPRNEVVRVVPKIVELGDEAGDALIDGLSARKTFVRQAFALALGHLKLRRAVVPLLHLLASEESDVWHEVARVLGGFGQASQRTVARQLKDPKGPRDRYILTLAHLANHGCEKQVDKLTKEERASVAAMAVEALTLRQEAKTIDDRARGDKPLPKKDPVLEFSRRFYAELEGRAPDGDLEE